MSYLAYDLEQLRLLRSAMRTVADELRTTTCDDPAAAPATQRITLARLHLEQQWLPLVDRLAAADPLADPFDTSRLSLHDLGEALLRLLHDRPGWLLGEAGAPMGATGAAPPTPAEAAVLADAMRHGDLDELTDTRVERQLLAAQLAAIAADPAARAAFVAGFDRLDDLATVLGRRRQRALDGHDDDDAWAEAASVDRVLAGLARIVTNDGGPRAVADLALTLDPYDGAALVHQAALDADTLADVGLRLLRQVREGREDARIDQWPEEHFGGPNTGDLLFETMLRTPGAPTAFVIAVQDEPDLLWWSATDADLPEAVALIGTDPANIAPADAGAVLHGFTDWFRQLGAPWAPSRHVVPPAEYRSFLGDLAVPWFADYGAIRSDWDLERNARRADLAFVIADPEARRAIFAEADRIAATIDRDGPGSSTGTGLVESFGMLLEVDEERKVHEAETAKASWDLSWKWAQLFVKYAAKQLDDAGTYITEATELFKRAVEANGWLNAPPPPGDVAVQAEVERYRALVAAQSVALTATYLSMRDSGALPAGVPPPPPPNPDAADLVEDFKRNYQLWKAAHVPEGSDVGHDLDRVAFMFISATDDGPGVPTG